MTKSKEFSWDNPQHLEELLMRTANENLVVREKLVAAADTPEIAALAQILASQVISLRSQAAAIRVSLKVRQMAFEENKKKVIGATFIPTVRGTG